MTFLGMVASVLLSAATAQTAAQKPTPSPNTVTLQGCVSTSPNARNMYTLDNEGQTYVLKGMNVRDFIGKHVEVIGVTVKRPRIVGGLYPSPNLAGQPDDPTKVAMAAHSGPTSQSARPSIDFNVKSVRALNEPCPTEAR